MKVKKSDILTIVLFCGFLFAMTVGYLLLPKKDFSESEKRYLTEAPKVTWDSVSSGEWGDEAETYMADHIPGRDFFVGLNAYFDLLTGRQVSKDIWLEHGYLLEAPVEDNPAAVDSYLSYIRNFANTIGQHVDVMIIPSAGWSAGLPEYPDSQIIDSIYAQCDGLLNPVDIRYVFQNGLSLYYKTDHHWTSEGAHAAYAAYMQAIGRDFRPESEFEKTIACMFHGSTYSRSALWLTPAEPLELWYGSDEITVTNGESDTTNNGVFYLNRLEDSDKFTVFLDGNHSIVRVYNPAQQGKLLVIRDSYSNSLGCFLAESYGEVVLVDMRYYKQHVSQLVTEEGFDNILVCYSVGHFLTDGNLIWLK